MQFKPKTDDELYPKYKEGDAQFEIVSAKEGSTQGGVPYLELNIKFYDADGRQGYVHDWLYGTDKSIWKLKLFADSVGLETEYMNGDITPQMCSRKAGICVLAYRKNKDSGKDELIIARYLKEKTEASQNDTSKQRTSSQLASTDKFEDDDIPF
jgi:hypothetical protein